MESITRVPMPGRASVRVPVLILSVIIEPEYKQISALLPLVNAQRKTIDAADRVLEIERWTIQSEGGFSFDIATAYINGMGNACSARETLIYLQRITPKFVFLCGIAGSLDPDTVGLGDVVIARSVQWWNLNKISKDTARPDADGRTKYLQLGEHFLRKAVIPEGQHTNHWDKRLTSFAADHKHLLRSNRDATLFNLKGKLQGSTTRSNILHYGKIVSWEYVLSDAAIRETMKQDPEGGVAVEMEGGGFSSSIRRRNEEMKAQDRRLSTEIPSDIVGFVFRGISDLAHDKGREPQDWRKLAMFNAANAVVDFLQTFMEADFVE